jgi:uncharacterized protein (TIGR02679 family)
VSDHGAPDEFASAVDRVRLRATLGRAELSRFVAALRRRLELGRPLTGTLSLAGATRDERAAFDELLGRRTTRGSTLLVNLDTLSRLLADAAICPDLESAVRALVGPTVNRRTATAREAAAWEHIWRQAGESIRQPELLAWLGDLAREGVVKRLCNTAQSAATVLNQLARVAGALPVSGEPLAAFAARLLGDAHALDAGSPLATLAVRAAARLGGVELKDDAEGRRSVWASVGVMCDELSTPALVLNIPTAGPGPLAELLRVAMRYGEPVHVSLHHLLRDPLYGERTLHGRTVFVCENPTTIGLAAARLGARCAPLVCVNGQFATPSLVLLRQLRSAGATLLYHGDFDPGGLVIARRAFAECGACPWRLGESDYLSAPKGIGFEGRPGPTPWSPGLETAMAREQRAVHEEAIFETLAVDLAGE